MGVHFNDVYLTSHEEESPLEHVQLGCVYILYLEPSYIVYLDRSIECIMYMFENCNICKELPCSVPKNERPEQSTLRGAESCWLTSWAVASEVAKTSAVRTCTVSPAGSNKFELEPCCHAKRQRMSYDS